MRLIKWAGIIILLVIIIYFLGPRPGSPKLEMNLPVLPSEARSLENYVSDNESLHKLKKDNQARIIWSDSTKSKTDYAVVYLHGFSASQEEGDPVHEDFAKKFGCNLYLSRLAEHGIDTTEPLLNFTADKLWNSAKEAYAIGRQLGKNVHQPVLLLYYYKDDKHQDAVVKVSAMKRMFSQLGTKDSLKRAIALPNTGNHVIGSYIKSKDIPSVERECERFAFEVLHLMPSTTKLQPPTP